MFEIYEPVTSWSVDGKHNHISNGWSLSDVPRGNLLQEKSWNGLVFKKHHCYLKYIGDSNIGILVQNIS